MNRDDILEKLKIIGRVSIFFTGLFFITFFKIRSNQVGGPLNKTKQPASGETICYTFVEEKPSFRRKTPVALNEAVPFPTWPKRPIQTSRRPMFASVSFFWEYQRKVSENVQTVKTTLSQKVENSITRPQQAQSNIRRSMAELEEDHSRSQAREASSSRSPIRLNRVRPTRLRAFRRLNEENHVPRAQRRTRWRTSRNRNQENNITSERERAGSPVSSETDLNDNRGTDLNFQYLPTLNESSMDYILGMPLLPQDGYCFEQAGFTLELGTGSLPLYLGVPIRVVDMRLGGEADIYFSPTGRDETQDRVNINVPDHKILPEYSSIGEESTSDESPCYMIKRCAAKRRPQLIHPWNSSMEWSEDSQIYQTEAVCEAYLAQLLKARDVIYNTVGAGFIRLVDRYSQIENPQVVLSRSDADFFHRQSLAFGKAHIHYKAVLETLPSFQNPAIINPTSLDYQNSVFHAMASQQLLAADEDFSHTRGDHLPLKAPVENVESDEATTSNRLRSDRGTTLIW